MLRDDPAYAEKAARVSALAKDITEYLATLDLGARRARSGLTVAYHSACSMQHGQKITRPEAACWRSAGFTVQRHRRGPHLLRLGRHLQHPAARPRRRLRDRKVANIAKTRPDVIATGNIGCITQIASGTTVPIVHTVELLDWATGGPKPNALAEHASDSPPKLERRSGTAVEAA